MGEPVWAGVAESAGVADPGCALSGEAGCIWWAAGVVSAPSSEPPHPTSGAARRTKLRASGFFMRVG